MEIFTNISAINFVHDAIKYPPIERQVFDFFCGKFTKVAHESDRDGFIFILDDTRCRLEVLKKDKGVQLTIEPPYPGIRFGEGKYPSVRLPYNADVTNKTDKFCDAVRKIQDLEKRAAVLPAIASAKEIEAFLKQELSTDRVTVSYWNENLFSGVEIGFYLHPNGTAPADGVYVCLEKDTNKIIPFWNRSTERRAASYGGVEQIEWAVGRPNQFAPREDLAAMKVKIEAIEKLKVKIDAFDPTKSPEFMRLLDVKRQADKLVKEFIDLFGRKS